MAFTNDNSYNCNYSVYLSFITTTTTIVICIQPLHTTSTITNAVYTLTTINLTTTTLSFKITSDTWLPRAAKLKFLRRQRPRQLLPQAIQQQQFTTQQQ